jgi:hypothetical protein
MIILVNRDDVGVADEHVESGSQSPTDVSPPEPLKNFKILQRGRCEPSDRNTPSDEQRKVNLSSEQKSAQEREQEYKDTRAQIFAGNFPSNSSTSTKNTQKSELSRSPAVIHNVPQIASPGAPQVKIYPRSPPVLSHLPPQNINYTDSRDHYLQQSPQIYSHNMQNNNTNFNASYPQHQHGEFQRDRSVRPHPQNNPQSRSGRNAPPAPQNQRPNSYNHPYHTNQQWDPDFDRGLPGHNPNFRPPQMHQNVHPLHMQRGTHNLSVNNLVHDMGGMTLQSSNHPYRNEHYHNGHNLVNYTVHQHHQLDMRRTHSVPVQNYENRQIAQVQTPSPQFVDLRVDPDYNRSYNRYAPHQVNEYMQPHPQQQQNVQQHSAPMGSYVRDRKSYTTEFPALGR